jgi:hypothetical protein
MNNRPKSIDAIVIGIWVLLGLALVFSLFDATKIRNLELYVQFVAALATVGSVYFAYRAIKLSAATAEELRKDKALELEFKKPEFQLITNSLEQYNLGLNSEGEARFTFEAHAIQVGTHPATSVYATSYLLDWELKKQPVILKEENANDIHQSSSIHIGKDSIVADKLDDLFFHIMAIQYRDKITGRKHLQVLYKKLVWDDSEKWYYTDVTHEERERLENYLKEQHHISPS